MTFTDMKIKTFLDWKNQKPKRIDVTMLREFKGSKIKAEQTQLEQRIMIETSNRILRTLV